MRRRVRSVEGINQPIGRGVNIPAPALWVPLAWPSWGAIPLICENSASEGYSIAVNLGSQGTTFNMHLDTGSADTWVPSEHCQQVGGFACVCGFLTLKNLNKKFTLYIPLEPWLRSSRVNHIFRYGHLLADKFCHRWSQWWYYIRHYGTCRLYTVEPSVWCGQFILRAWKFRRQDGSGPGTGGADLFNSNLKLP